MFEEEFIMSSFSRLFSFAKDAPEWVLYFSPCLFLVAGVLCLIFKKVPLFAASAFFFGGVQTLLATAILPLEQALCEIALFLCETGILLLFLCLPARVGKREKKSREDEIFEKFYQPLEPVSGRSLPPKVSANEEEYRTAEEDGLRFEYVGVLINKLRAAKLSPGDRLETDVIARSVCALKDKKLSPEEKELLGDYLSSLIKLVAKYSAA